MGVAKSPLVLDWIGLTIRWIFIVSVSVWLAFGIGFDLPIVLVLVLAVLGNIFWTAAVMLDRMVLVFRFLSLLGDLLFAYILFSLGGTSSGGLAWVGLLPVITGALYYQYIGVILISILNLIAQGWLGLSFTEIQELLILVGILLPLYIVIGLPVAYFSQRLKGGEDGFSWWGYGSRNPIGQAERERRLTIYELISGLSKSLNYQRVLESSLDMSAAALNKTGASADKLVSAVLLFTDGADRDPFLKVAAYRRLLATDARIKLTGTKGVLGRTIEEAEQHLTKTANRDPELSRFVAVQACRSAYCFPLRTGLDTYGILFFAHPDPEYFGADQREILDIVGNQSLIALQNARLYNDLEQEKERMMEIQEEARKKMARDLHDGPTQSISAIAMRVNFARRLMERDPNSAAEEMYKIEDLARRTTKEIRHMLFTLRPLVLESQGLIAALESMAEKMRETYEQEVIIEAEERVVNALELGKQAVVFYIAEEAVNNARKHADAKHIWVRLRLLKDDLSLLEIEDDGVGFDSSEVDIAYEHRGSLGLVNMRERSELVNGVLQVESEIGKGTRIRLVIPLTEAAADRIHRGI